MKCYKNKLACCLRLLKRTLLDRLLDEAGLWKIPETLVVVVGGQTQVTDALTHHSLRNTIHGIYLALHRPAAPAVAAPRPSRLAGTSKELSTVFMPYLPKCSKPKYLKMPIYKDYGWKQN